MQQGSLKERIEREVRERAGIRVTVEERDGSIRLSGRVDSEEDRDTAASIASQMAAGVRIVNDLRVEMPVSDAVATLGAGDPRTTDPIESIDVVEEAGSMDEFVSVPNETLDAVREGGTLDPDFTDLPLDTDAINVIEDGEVPYFPPTDPVIRIDAQENAEVLGGFSPTSMTEMEADPSAEGARIGDDALAAAVLHELRRDALTTDLRIHVDVRQGVVRLRGRVTGLEDAENAEAVAGSVPGVLEVIEELDVVEI